MSEGPAEGAAANAAGGPRRLLTGAMLGLASGAILVPLNSTMPSGTCMTCLLRALWQS